MINRLAGQVFNNRMACRTAWWQMQQTVCLDNVPVKRQGKKDIVLALAEEAGDGVVVKGSGTYVPGQGVQARVNWGTSITVEWLKEA